ncbi:hypothetical protein PR001_g27949 [Phytophthora rubi]|uniref:Reverse transcriptase Ty1/copia-type domain-containing protein n=1 Tax=Phytophthora rubi TaxID=129364 RepID=A0A6A3HD88_9STRA|nr:hypothetical protein PR001_g27949 [Phytophthora rubi]
MEEELVAAGHAAQGFRERFRELGILIADTMVMYMDNQAAIKQVQNATISGKAKHIDVKYNFTKDLAAKGINAPTYVPTGEMETDLLTNFHIHHTGVWGKCC